MTVSPPRTPAAFTQRLEEIADSLPKRLRQCADFAAANSDRIAVVTVAEFAAGAGVPPSAVMRFAQVLGFSGYTDMRRLFRGQYASARPDYHQRLSDLRDKGAGSASALLAEFVESGQTSLENIIKTVDPRMLDIAVARLAAAGAIHVIGLRRAFPAASYLSYAFDKMEIPAFLHDGIGKLSQVSAVRPGDVVLAITFTPFSAETIALAEAAHAKGASVVAITDAALGPLRRLDAALLVVAETEYGAFRPLAATMTLAIALAVAVGAARETK